MSPRKILFWGCAVFLCFAARLGLAQEFAAAPDKTESPYFFIPNADLELDALPLKSTQVDVRVAGVIADVTVTQTYRNEGARPIEARYLFPASTRAAVHAMTVRLADRIIEAQIREKAEARRDYDQAKSEGKTAALLEQQRPNVFQMNVANILPGDEVRVELRYTELLRPEAGRYQFVFPTVVGPRYNSPQSAPESASESASAQEEWVAQPTLRAGEETPSTFDLRLKLASPIGVKAIHSPSHEITVEQRDARHAEIALKTGKAANNRDFILDYRLAGDVVESGAMLMTGADENFFLAMIEPPKATPTRMIVPREYIFVVDVSGSMHGFPLDTAKVMLRELIGGLRPIDAFNVMLFSGGNRFLHKTSVPATPENIERALRLIDQESGGGGTELIPAIQRVYAQHKPDDVSRTIIVVTDGYVSVEREAFKLVREHLDQANLFAFGIGGSVNRHLIEGLARAGMGEPFVITQPDEATATAERFRRMIASPVLAHVAARFEGLETYDVTPQKLPDVLAERPVILFGKWRPGKRQDANGQQGTITITGQGADGPYRQTLPLYEATGASKEQYGALRHLWARQRIAELSDQENLEGEHALRDEITALGLKYSLLTQYTSFIAIDKVARNLDAANTVGVDQPLPLPSGVSDMAISGANVPGAPEPESLAALLVALAMLVMIAHRRSRQRRPRMTE
jgi:Ca-activated chloride channel family protein